MTFKRVTSPVAGDASHYGGLDINKFADYLGATDIGASETVDIATLTTFRDSKFTLRNPANTFSYVFVPSAIAASRNVTLPLLTGADQITMDAHTTTITNKTVNATNNTITDTSTAAGDIFVSNGTKFVRKGRGTSLQVIRTNSGATDIEWYSPQREDLALYAHSFQRLDSTTTYADMSTYTNFYDFTVIVQSSTGLSIDFTNKTQVKAQWHHMRGGTSSQSIRIVDATSDSNVLFEQTAIASDGWKTVALTALPGWATGVQGVQVQCKAGSGSTDDISIGHLSIWLK